MSRSAENDAPVRALRFAQSQAVTERARGRIDEERAWLDMCALLESCVNPPVTSVEPGCTCGGVAACQQCQDRDAGTPIPPVKSEGE